MTLAADLESATVEYHAEDDGAVATLKFSGDETFFEGHFPAGPVLPAVVQVSAAMKLAERVVGRELRLVEVTRAKFMNPTAPGRELVFRIQTEPVEELLRVKARITEGDKDIAEFTLRLA